MNENINLCEILKGHEGETFYSPVYGIVKAYIEGDKIKMQGRYNYMMLNSQGFNNNHEDLYDCLECLIFPSKTQRDWNKWLEEQKPKVPKTWSELVETNQNKSYGVVINTIGTGVANAPIEKAALALLKIHQLIEVGYGGNISNWEWKDRSITKWRIEFDCDNEIMIDCYISPIVYTPTAFHTKEQAEEFLKYPENIQLLKDYFIILK